MSETEIAEAIAEQEEYLKRIGPCRGQLGATHSWDQFSARPGAFHKQCWRCGVTRTSFDHDIKIGRA